MKTAKKIQVNRYRADGSGGIHEWSQREQAYLFVEKRTGKSYPMRAKVNQYSEDSSGADLYIDEDGQKYRAEPGDHFTDAGELIISRED